MLLWLRHCAAGCAAGALALLPVAPASGQRVDPGAPAAWAMPGHDAQRTSQGIGVGPQRTTTPHLVLRSLTASPPIIGADGSLYGVHYPDPSKPDARVIALSPTGHVRWTAWARRRGWPGGDLGASLVLAPDGSVYFAGGACRPSVAQRRESAGTAGCLSAVGPNGSLRWRTVTLGLTKGIPKPLVRPDGALVRATIGPGGGPDPGTSRAAVDATLNVTVYARNGVPLRLGADCSWSATALGSADRLYAVTDYRASLLGNCLPYSTHPGQPGSNLVAFTAGGTRIWATALPLAARPENCAPWALTVDAARGHIFAATSCNAHGQHAHVRVYALDTQGHLRWMRDEASAGWPTLALDRVSGDLWLATNDGVQRLSPAGARRWHTTWPTTATPASAETVVLDARGTAYVCGADGLLRALSPTGSVLWRYQFRVPRDGSGAEAALGPDGTLYVSSEDAGGIVVFPP